MNGKLVKVLILFWTIITFLVDVYYAISSESITGMYLIISLMIVEILICGVAYEMVMGKRWGLITLTVYYGLRSMNIYTEDFSFYSKSGFNIEISFGNTIGINLLTLITFIILIRVLSNSGNIKTTSTHPG